MLYLVATIMFFLGIRYKSDRRIQFLMLVFLWTLFGWSYGNADWATNERRFTQNDALRSQTEFAYNSLANIFHTLNLEYRAFLLIGSAVTLFCYYIFVKNYTRYVNIVFAFYMIFPFCMDVTVVRYTFASALIMMGISVLLSEDNYWLPKYVILVLCAAMIHISTIVCLVFIFGRLFKRRKLIVVVLIIDMTLYVSSGMALLLANKIANISFLNIGTKVNIILTAASRSYNLYDILRYGAKIIFVFGVFVIICAYIKTHLKLNIYDKEINKHIKIINLILKLNITSLLILPLITFSPDLFRIQMTLFLINYVGIAQYFDIRNKVSLRIRNKMKISKNCAVVILLTLIYSVGGLYIWVLGGPNINTVFKPLFENNILYIK